MEPTSIPNEGDTLGLEHHFDITIKKSKVGKAQYLYPHTYVAVSCNGEARQTRVSPREETTVWDDTFHFSYPDSPNPEDIILNVGLYRKSQYTRWFKPDSLLFEVKKKLSDFPRNEVISQALKDVSVDFRVGKSSLRAPSRMFALIVAVDNYKSSRIPNLRGCVRDAKDMEDLLKTELYVPESNICVLLNEAATRKNILDTFKSHLLQNDKIRDNANYPIIIFFAGHGSRVDAPEGWTSPDGKIEAICPYDEWEKDEDDKYIPGIPDLTINSIVRKLATVKGNNITLILDSCHSGGNARDLLSDGYSSRSFENPCPIDSNVDQDIWTPGSRAASHALLSGFKHKDMASHILLAACKQDEKALEVDVENEKRGLFTAELVKTLRKSIREATNISYSQLIDSVSEALSGQQTPQCEGENKQNHVFKLGALVREKAIFKLKRTSSGCYVDLGSVHGVIQEETEFIVRPSEELSNHRGKGVIGGILIASNVLVNKSKLAPRSDNPDLQIPEDAVVSVWNWNKKDYYLDVFADFKDASQHINPTESEYPTSNFRIVKELSAAHISISANDRDKTFNVKRLPGFVSRYPGIRGLPDKECPQHEFVEPNLRQLSLPRVLDAIFRFRYHLEQGTVEHPYLQVKTGIRIGTTPTAEDKDNTPGRVELHLFVLSTDTFGFPIPKLPVEDIFKDNGVAVLKASELSNTYGFAIQNGTNQDLFVYLFYFDPEDYSIQEWYIPRNPSDMLKQTHTLTIGYGAGGGDPFQFSLSEGESDSTGFLKLFLSTTYVDMTHIIQPSPFSAQLSGRVSASRKPIGKIDTYVSMVAQIQVITET